MSFSTNVPNANQSPNLFPTQNQTNMGRLKTIIRQDHVFNDTTDATTDGIHKKVSLQTRSGIATKPSGAASVLYARNDGSSIPQLRFYNGTEYTLTPNIQPAVSILACVNFDGLGSINDDQTIRSSYGVSTVFQTDPGIYKINFSPELANADYIVSITGMRGVTGIEPVFGCVNNSDTYENEVTTAFLWINFFSEKGTFKSVLMGNVVIYGLA